MSSLAGDLRFALRTLLASAGFTVVAVLTLALGIGANTAVFTLVNSVLLKPMALRDPEHLLHVRPKFSSGGTGAFSIADLQDMRQENRHFEQLEATFPSSHNLKTQDRPEHVQGAMVTSGFLGMLGVPPVLGRTFVNGEDQPGSSRVAVLREDLWKRDFAGDRSLIGKTIPVDGEVYTVVGIMPASLRFPSQRTEIWVPLVPDVMQLNRGNHFLRVVGRLKPAATLEQARAEMNAIVTRLTKQYPKDDGNWRGVEVRSVQDQMVAAIRRTLLLMLGAVGFVFLISCANVANLLLARASSRQKEIAIRRALGATGGRLLRQFFAESLLLATTGAALGWLIAIWGIDLFVALRPAGFPRLNEIHPDTRVLLFTISISVLAAIAFGITTLLHSSPVRIEENLRSGSRTSTGGQRGRLRSLLVIGEVAIALILMSGSGLLMQSFWRLRQVSPGFRPERILTMRLDLPEAKYRLSSPIIAFYQPLVEKVDALPGVQAAGLIDILPIENWGVNGDFEIEGRPNPPGQGPTVEQRTVGEDFFQALGVPLVAGRFFTRADTKPSMPVVIINQSMARRFWKNESPVGKRIRFWNPEWVTIAGVVGDVRQAGLESDPLPELYMPYQQNPFLKLTLGMTLVVRTAGDPALVAGAIRDGIRSIDPDQPVSAVQTMDGVLSDYLASRRFTMSLLAGFAAVALLLSVLGIYGVISWSVRQRTREIGLRMALGASLTSIFQVVVVRGMGLVGIGLAIGIIGSLMLARVLSSLLYGVSATDPATRLGVCAILGLAALFAICLPARRAARVDPMVALRYE